MLGGLAEVSRGSEGMVGVALLCQHWWRHGSCGGGMMVVVVVVE